MDGAGCWHQEGASVSPPAATLAPPAPPGPKAKLPGYASVCEAYGGFRYINGYADR